MKELKKIFRVDEVTIGHAGDYSVGLPCEYSYVSLSDEMAEILQDNNTIEDFKKELFELFKKYNDEVSEMKDDVEDSGEGIYEMVQDMEKEEMKKRVDELEEEKKTKYPFSKNHQIELYILKKELEN